MFLLVVVHTKSHWSCWLLLLVTGLHWYCGWSGMSAQILNTRLIYFFQNTASLESTLYLPSDINSIDLLVQHKHFVISWYPVHFSSFETNFEKENCRFLHAQTIIASYFLHISSSLSSPSRPATSLLATVAEYSPSDVRLVMFSELLLSVVL